MTRRRARAAHRRATICGKPRTRASRQLRRRAQGAGEAAARLLSGKAECGVCGAAGASSQAAAGAARRTTTGAAARTGGRSPPQLREARAERLSERLLDPDWSPPMSRNGRRRAPSGSPGRARTARAARAAQGRRRAAHRAPGRRDRRWAGELDEVADRAERGASRARSRAAELRRSRPRRSSRCIPASPATTAGASRICSTASTATTPRRRAKRVRALIDSIVVTPKTGDRHRDRGPRPARPASSSSPAGKLPDCTVALVPLGLNVNITDPIFHDEAKALAPRERSLADGEVVCPFCESTASPAWAAKPKLACSSAMCAARSSPCEPER
jgi:hypothetical protein